MPRQSGSIRPRNKDGTFKSAFDIQIERDEAEWHAEIKAKMDAGMTFDDAWVSAGGMIIPLDELMLMPGEK